MDNIFKVLKDLLSGTQKTGEKGYRKILRTTQIKEKLTFTYKSKYNRLFSLKFIKIFLSVDCKNYNIASISPALAGRFFPTAPPEKTQFAVYVDTIHVITVTLR